MAQSVDEVTADLVEWLGRLMPGVAVNASALGSQMRQSGVDLRLVRVAPGSRGRDGAGRTVIDLDYLVTVQLPDPASEQAAVAELVFAAMARADLEVLGGDAVAESCARLRLPYALGVQVRAQVARERQGAPVSALRESLSAAGGATQGDKPAPAEASAVFGRLLAAGNAPAPGAIVHAVELDRFALTDDDGRFSIAAAGLKGATVRLVARTDEQSVEGVAVAGLPITLRLGSDQP